MRRTTTIISATTVAVAGAATGLGIWIAQPSYDDIVKSCQKALAAQAKAGGEGKPAACKGVKDDDYTTLVLSNAIKGLPKDERDTLDYSDDGSVNGSLTDGQ